jgi:glutathione S-transferase
MKLYSGPLSLFTAKVRIALAEKGLPYERIEVGWSPADRYLPHHPDVVRLNPKAQVPVLVDGGTSVYDSTLILEYLEDVHPIPALYPPSGAARARCRQLEAAADELLFPHVWDLIDEVFYPASEAERDPARTATARAHLARFCSELEKDIGTGPWLCGEAFSVADLSVFIFLHVAGTLGAPLPETCTSLRAWFARAATRPSIFREVEEMQAFVAKTLAGP